MHIDPLYGYKLEATRLTATPTSRDKLCDSFQPVSISITSPRCSITSNRSPHENTSSLLSACSVHSASNTAFQFTSNVNSKFELRLLSQPYVNCTQTLLNRVEVRWPIFAVLAHLYTIENIFHFSPSPLDETILVLGFPLKLKYARNSTFGFSLALSVWRRLKLYNWRRKGKVNCMV